MLSAGHCSKISQLRHLPALTRPFSLSKTRNENHNHSCKVLVVGGGTGGCAVSAKLSRIIKKTDLIVLEPSSEHYYQPLFTLIGAGIGSIDTARKTERECLTENCTWIKDQAAEFDLNKNIVRTNNGHQIKYDYLVVSTGIVPRYEKIPGLLDSLKDHSSGVCSIYLPKYVENVFPTMKRLNSGNAIFTFPNSPVKCPGAPQKICYLTEDYLRRENKRSKVNVIYNTSLPVIFGVKKYADALWKICETRNISVNTRTNLLSIDPEKKQAVFENLDKPDVKTVLPYSMLHVTPPMSAAESISNNKQLTNGAGFVEVDKGTLQHVRFSNVFAIGDCSSSPNSKTAAAAGSASRCIICGATPKEMNQEAVLKKEPNINNYRFGLSTLHCWISFFECLLHIGYRMPLKTWQVKGAETKEIFERSKKRIQLDFKTKLGLIVAKLKPGYGSTNDGNTSRTFFKNFEISSDITAAQVEVVFQNLQAVMKSQKPLKTYDGYASCPLVTGYNKCILAEFDYDLNPLETFPFSQDKERLSMYLLKKNIIPAIYWSLMMKGLWNGPAMFRKIMHLGRDK